MYDISAKEVQKNCFSWNWRVIQNFEEKLTYGLENDMKNLANFYQNTRKSQNWDFDGILSSKIKQVEGLKRGINLLKRNRLVILKLTRGIWRIIIRALKSLKNLHFNGVHLNKIYNVWAKKVQRSYVWWYWRLMQNLKKNWFVLSKMTWGIWKIFTGWKTAISF